MKLALLKGNRFNPWHLQAFNRLPDAFQITAFRADSEIQRHFQERGEDRLAVPVEQIYFDTQRGPFPGRLSNRLLERFRNREPRIRPFHDRLRGFDCIQTWELFTDWSAQALDAKRRHGTPVCVMVWDNIPFNMERNPRKRAIKEAVARQADRFIVHTERSRRMLGLERVDPARVVKIGPGVDTEVFSPGPRDRARFGVGKDEFVILFVGWLLPRKGIDFLLLALRELVHDSELKDISVRLLVVGSGPGKDRVDRLVDRIGVRQQVTFAGALPYTRMPEAFRAADVFTLPSIATPEWQEQFGMALVEAMACGVPAVTTMTGAIPEVIGPAGVICQPSDFVSLYEALKRLIQNPAERERLGEAGRQEALSRFALDTYAEQLAAVYQGLV